MRGGSLRTALTLLRPHRLSLTVAMVLGVAATVASLGQPAVIGHLVGDIADGALPVEVLALLIGLFIAEALIAGVQALILGKAGNLVVMDLRRSLVGRLLRARMTDHQERRQGDVMARVVADTSLLATSLTQSMATMLLSGMTVLGAIVLMTITDPVLTGVTLACVLVAGASGLLIARNVRAATEETRERVGEFGTAVQRALGALSTIKISRAEQREYDRIEQPAQRALEAGMRVVRFIALMLPTVHVGVQAAYAVVFIVGAMRLAAGSLTLASFSAFLLYLLYMITPLVNFFAAVAQFQQGTGTVARVQGMLASPVEPGTAEPDEPRSVPAGPVLTFDEVSFGYRADSTVLDAVSFSVPAHGLTAIVGPTGAGKSTIFSLTERFWDSTGGSIRVHGMDVRELGLAELRGRVGLVEQDAPVVDGTIRENLLYANPDATREELADALDLANLTAWIDELPDGLDTQVGEGGGALSGGQRQRIAIGRMLLVRPDVLLLDEVTSQLDAQTEFALRESIRKVAQRCAVVVIAHRLSTVIEADRILLLDQGRVRAQGTHAWLMDADELYERLVRTQFAPLGTADQTTAAAETRERTREML